MARARDLVDLLETGDSLAVVCHDNPDPDTLGSAMALERIATDAGVEAVATYYGGTITHQQNRAFVNMFDMDLQTYEDEDEEEALADADLLAFVDHATPGRNNGLTPDTQVDIVIDHHQAEDVQGRFVDHRESVGACATILTEYLQDLAVDLDERLATALLFAIRRETLSFLRGATVNEFEAARHLHPAVDGTRLRRLANPPLTPGTIDAISDAIDNRMVRGSCLVSHVGRTTERDALPQAADYLADLEGITTTVVAGIVDDGIHLSARSTSPDRDVGEILRQGFGDVGSAGGHSDMAGGRIPLGLFAGQSTNKDDIVNLVATTVARRVFDAMNLPSPESDAATTAVGGGTPDAQPPSDSEAPERSGRRDTDE